MGIQICIKINDLLKAGWKVSITQDVSYEYCEGNGEREVFYDYLTIEKDGYIFYSYTDDSFVADCNCWGNNKHLFEKVGIMDIPHILS